MGHSSPSKLGAIFGLSPYKTREQQFLEDIGEFEPTYTDIEQKRMAAGLIYENSILDMFELWTGDRVVGRQVEYTHPSGFHGFVDGKILGEPYAVVDAKNTEEKNLTSDEYWLQMQGYMFLTGEKKAILVCPSGRYKVAFRVIDRDDTFINQTLLPTIEWWEACLKQKELVEPPLETQLYTEILLGNRAVPSELDSDIHGLMEELVDRYTEINSFIGTSKKQNDELREQIEELAKDFEGKVTFNSGATLTAKKTKVKGKIDYDLMLYQHPEINPDDYRDADTEKVSITIRGGKKNDIN